MTALTATSSKTSLWASRIMRGLPILFLLFDGGYKLFNPAPVAESFAALGYPDGIALSLGLLLIVCTIVYAIPRTAVLGAILLTGYLGGAIASHVRVGDPLFSLIFPIIIGGLLWGGLYLSDQRLRAIFPVRSE
ncbi:DoxX family protein [Herpetosiphon llansteffanensis]|uniref:DoxX family protein n=1 Tax=Herpetosiphon llansteffanensis TaxID=2094568 RepID=UPI000D7C569F|nr:DoxX family protein [Herpetosiphon llansteffanensis]